MVSVMSRVTLAETAWFAGLVVQGGDDYSGPEPRAVFAYSPAIVLAPAFLERTLEYLLRLTPSDVFVRIKTGKVMANDLVFLIPLVALGRRIPRDDVTCRVQHENGVLLHPFDEEAESFFRGAIRN